MENIPDSMKTPSRARKSSARESNDCSTKKQSVKKQVLTEIEESDCLLNNKDPTTPNRASRAIDFQTPSRSEAFVASQTPRRSVRKSIKPVQEYENIVAQKGLSAKRTTVTLADAELEEEDVGTKWEPSVIGRVSSKRSKKARRAKKLLKRQKKIEDENAQVQENVMTKSEEDAIENKDDNENISNEPADQVDDVENNEGNIDEDKQLPEVMIPPTIQIEEQNEDVSDTSMDGEDVVMSAMPITADDYMKSPEKITHLAPKISNVSDKSDDSDCMMLSLMDSRDSVELNMPTLLVCSDDEDGEMVDASQTRQDNKIEPTKDKQNEKDENTQLNRTFDTEEEDRFVDAVSSPGQINNGEEIEEEAREMPTLSEINQIIGDPNGTFDANETPKEELPLSVTPSHAQVTRPSITRNVTPFKSKQTIVPDILIEHADEMQDVETSEVFFIEPKESKLNSIRKRSISLCLDRPKKNVTFHSPSNTTVFMSSHHGELPQSARKYDPLNITKRRKRSLSVTETEREFLDYIQHKKPATDTPQKQKQQVSRIKLPNFSAIHLKQFQKMESISDHIARKAERAKVLTNSNTKVKPASVQKGLPVKNSVLREQNTIKTGNKSNLPKPKARQRIELSTIEVKTTDWRLKDLPPLRKTPQKAFEKSSFVFGSASKQNKVPKFNFTLNKEKMPLNAVKLTKGSTSTCKPIQASANRTIATTSATLIHRLPNPRANFNLSTAVAETKITKSTVDKVDERRKRLMDMYKSRSTQRGDKSKEILKGVRTNRRFELQMMCRNRPN